VQKKWLIILGLLTLPVMLGVGASIATKLIPSQQTVQSSSKPTGLQLSKQPEKTPSQQTIQQLSQQPEKPPSQQTIQQSSKQLEKPSSKVKTPSQQIVKSTSSRIRADALSLKVGNLIRQYNLYVPSSLNLKQPIPLVMAFHGAGGNGRSMERTTKFSQLAEQKHFIVVYPDSSGQRWDSIGRRPETRDIEFVSALIDRLSQQYNIDSHRIYVTGFSNGGVFSQRIACELSNKIAASAAVASTIAEELLQVCKPTQPIPMMLVNGDSDPGVPYGPLRQGWLSVPDTAKFWSKQNRCSPQPIQELLPGTSRVSVETYQQCANKTTVKLYIIQGGKHGWGIPRAQIKTPSAKPSQAMTLGTLIWDFFTQYP
jgi:polyhydroxybutyrate depolymerase